MKNGGIYYEVSSKKEGLKGSTVFCIETLTAIPTPLKNNKSIICLCLHLGQPGHFDQLEQVVAEQQRLARESARDKKARQPFS